MSYAERISTTHTDGSKLFAVAQDGKSETEVAAILGAAWGCEFRRFSTLSPLDWYVVRHERIMAVAELKSRSHDSMKFPTVFLNVRKWLALSLAGVGMGCKALFIVRFTDGLRWVNVSHIDASRVKIGGCASRVKSDGDIEPVIEVPVAAMTAVQVTG